MVGGISLSDSIEIVLVFIIFLDRFQRHQCIQNNRQIQRESIQERLFQYKSTGNGLQSSEFGVTVLNEKPIGLILHHSQIILVF